MDIKTINKHLATIANCNGIVEISVMETSSGDIVKYFLDYDQLYIDKSDYDKMRTNKSDWNEWTMLSCTREEHFRNFDEIDFMAIKNIDDFCNAMGIDINEK